MSIITRNRSAVVAIAVAVPAFHQYRCPHASLGDLLPYITLEARIDVDRPGVIVGIPEIV
jgi:hypothetical protein